MNGLRRPSTVADVVKLDLPRHVRDDGVLVVAEGLKHVPFAVARLFTVEAPLGAVRGRHAHWRCSQFMICVYGAIEFLVDDGAVHKAFVLEHGHEALYVPPLLWQSLTFRAPKAVLVGICDRPYEEDDYIRDYDAFLDARRRTSA
ncbi:MAG TPA: FdtA/QdtA family cupin domain-containing protein [Pseudolabrys sp.]|nr:FdtA/QdtA family cupin domain-containing protein [Pseudolabrys sp.]